MQRQLRGWGKCIGRGTCIQEHRTRTAQQQPQQDTRPGREQTALGRYRRSRHAQGKTLSVLGHGSNPSPNSPTAAGAPVIVKTKLTSIGKGGQEAEPPCVAGSPDFARFLPPDWWANSTRHCLEVLRPLATARVSPRITTWSPSSWVQIPSSCEA